MKGRRIVLDDATLKDVDLKAANLSWASLKGADLRNANLRGANLENANLDNAILAQADLQGVNLRNSSLRGAQLDGAYIENAELEGADLTQARLFGANLKRANLGKVNFTAADLRSVLFKETNLTTALLQKANLDRADLESANLAGALLRDASLVEARLTNSLLRNAAFIGTRLKNADFFGANLSGIIYEPAPGSLPTITYIAYAQNLWQLTFRTSPQGLMELRDEFRKAGMRHQEKDLTYAIKHSELQLMPVWERTFNYVFFEATSAWGREPFRPLLVLIMLIPLFAVAYLGALRESGPNGIWRYWPDDRVRKDIGTTGPERLRPKGIAIVVYALYFSLLSAFRIGWRELNIGEWITRFQTHEYTLRATGWARTVSAIQSMISVYLLALAVLTYFGRPFE